MTVVGARRPRLSQGRSPYSRPRDCVAAFSLSTGARCTSPRPVANSPASAPPHGGSLVFASTVGPVAPFGRLVAPGGRSPRRPPSGPRLGGGGRRFAVHPRTVAAHTSPSPRWQRPPSGLRLPRERRAYFEVRGRVRRLRPHAALLRAEAVRRVRPAFGEPALRRGLDLGPVALLALVRVGGVGGGAGRRHAIPHAGGARHSSPSEEAIIIAIRGEGEGGGHEEGASAAVRPKQAAYTESRAIRTGPRGARGVFPTAAMASRGGGPRGRPGGRVDRVRMLNMVVMAEVCVYVPWASQKKGCRRPTHRVDSFMVQA